MARTLIVVGAPAYANPQAVLLQANVVINTITLVEATNTPGKYTGDLVANAGTFDVSIQDDFGAAGLYEGVEMAAAEGTVVHLPQKVPTIGGPQFTATHGTSGDTIPTRLS